MYNFLKQFIVSKLEQFVNRDGVSSDPIQVPKTAAPQDSVTKCVTMDGLISELTQNLTGITEDKFQQIVVISLNKPVCLKTANQPQITANQHNVILKPPHITPGKSQITAYHRRSA